MAKPFGALPKNAQSVERFTISVSDDELDAFKDLLKLSKVAAPSYESSCEDRKYGVTASWMANAKEHWLNRFDW